MNTRSALALVLSAAALGCGSDRAPSGESAPTGTFGTNCIDAGGECKGSDPDACLTPQELSVQEPVWGCGSKENCCFPRRCGDNDFGRCTFFKDKCSVPLRGDCGTRGAICCQRW